MVFLNFIPPLFIFLSFFKIFSFFIFLRGFLNTFVISD